MAWSYAPDSQPFNCVRRLISDTNEQIPLLQDEEITNALDDEGQNIFRAAASCCRTLSLFFARQLSIRSGQAQIDAKERSDAFIKAADYYLSRAARGAVIPFAGGMSLSEKETVAEDDDRVAPFFKRNMHRYPGVPASADSNDER